MLAQARPGGEGPKKVPRLGLINLEGYIAFSLFPHLSAIPLHWRSPTQAVYEMRREDPDAVVVSTMEIPAMDETFTLCGSCTRALPRGFSVV
jgi:hypothetical protein